MTQIKRPVPVVRILKDFASELIYKIALVSVLMLFLWWGRDVSDLWKVAVAVGFVLLVILVFFVIYTNKKVKVVCQHCQSIGDHSDSYCSKCGRDKTPENEKEKITDFIQLSDSEKLAYIKGAAHSQKKLVYIMLTMFFLPVVLGLAIGFVWFFSFIPIFILFIFFVIPLYTSFWMRAPCCGHETLMYVSKHSYSVLNFCCNCGEALGERLKTSKS